MCTCRRPVGSLWESFPPPGASAQPLHEFLVVGFGFAPAVARGRCLSASRRAASRVLFALGCHTQVRPAATQAAPSFAWRSWGGTRGARSHCCGFPCWPALDLWLAYRSGPCKANRRGPCEVAHIPADLPGRARASRRGAAHQAPRAVALTWAVSCGLARAVRAVARVKLASDRTMVPGTLWRASLGASARRLRQRWRTRSGSSARWRRPCARSCRLCGPLPHRAAPRGATAMRAGAWHGVGRWVRQMDIGVSRQEKERVWEAGLEVRGTNVDGAPSLLIPNMLGIVGPENNRGGVSRAAQQGPTGEGSQSACAGARPQAP